MRVLLVAIYMVLSVSGIVLVKAGAGRSAFGLADGLLQMKLDVFTISGLSCYIVSFLLFIKVLSLYELHHIVPITTGIVQIMILLAAFFIFKEKIATINLVGTLVVIIGVVLMNIRQKGIG